MKIYNALLLSLISLCSGILFFGFKHELIVIRNPYYITTSEHKSITKYKKKIALIFWHLSKFKTETIEVLWNDHIEHNISCLITHWLNLLEEEHILEKKVTLQTAMLNTSGQLFISFDRSPLPKEESLYTKLMLIEGLLKTIRTNDIPIQTVYFLVHHQPLQDSHLDFSNPWPVVGFLSEK